MSGYTIGRIYIENFKLIKKEHAKTINDFIKHKNMNLLSGPNGFGKTTVFDVFELAFTNGITRIIGIDNGVSKPDDIIFANNTNEDVLLKVELVSDSGNKTIIKRIKTDKNKKVNTSSKEHDKLFDTYIVNDFNEAEKNWGKRIENLDEKIIELIGLNRDAFNIFCHIKQHDNTHYLAKGDKARVAPLSMLLNTTEIDEKIKLLGDFYNKFDDLYKADIKKAKEINKEIDIQGKIKFAEVTYFKLFSWFEDNKIKWDMENASITESDLKQIEGIKSFVNFFESFVIGRENDEYKIYLENDSLIENTAIFARFIGEYEQIKQRYNEYKKMKKFENIFFIDSFLDFINIDDIESLSNEYNLKINIPAIRQDLSRIAEYAKTESSSSKTLSELNMLRNSMLNYLKGSNVKLLDNESCPFCGTLFESNDRLISAIEQNSQRIELLCQDISLLKDSVIRKLWQEMSGLRSFVRSYLDNNDNVISEEFFDQLEKASLSKEKIKLFLKFLNLKQIDISAYVNSSLNIAIKDIADRKNSIKELLKSKIRETVLEYENENRKHNFEEIFNDFFLNEVDYVKAITLNAIDDKKKLMEIYRDITEKSKADIILKNDLNSLMERLVRQKYFCKKIAEIKKIFEENKKSYEGRVIGKIEIPLHIYTGKILQEHQRGVGVFVQMDKKNENLNMIRFIADKNTGHDVLNTFSSGQIAAFVIAFTLAMNKVYQNNKFKTIFIDDPVQTMDEINMVSFVELLRNEFPDKQIFLSTHEDNVAKFIDYKFAMYGIDSQMYNVKEKLNS